MGSQQVRKAGGEGPRTDAPVAAEQYGRRLARKSRARVTPLDVDWLVTRHIVRNLRYAAATYARGTLLDVGCGGRPYESIFRPHVRRYVGLDTPASTESRPDVGALAGRLPFTDGSIDTVLCNEVLEHVADPAACLGEMSRVLRAGGHLVLTAPQAWNLHEEPYDFFRYTKYGLKALCRRAGLEVVEIRPNGGAWAAVGITIIVHFGSYARWLLHGTERPPAPANGAAARRSPAVSNAWQKWVWPFRLPIALVNLFFAVLDAIPHPGIFVVDNMLVARSPEQSNRRSQRP